MKSRACKSIASNASVNIRFKFDKVYLELKAQIIVDPAFDTLKKLINGSIRH